MVAMLVVFLLSAGGWRKKPATTKHAIFFLEIKKNKELMGSFFHTHSKNRNSCSVTPCSPPMKTVFTLLNAHRCFNLARAIWGDRMYSLTQERFCAFPHTHTHKHVYRVSSVFKSICYPFIWSRWDSVCHLEIKCVTLKFVTLQCGNIYLCLCVCMFGGHSKMVTCGRWKEAEQKTEFEYGMGEKKEHEQKCGYA